MKPDSPLPSDGNECLIKIKEETGMDALQHIANDCIKTQAPAVDIGDTVKVHVWIKEGEKKRIQVFEGTVIAKKHGGHFRNLYRTPCVRTAAELERVFPVHTPNIDKVELVRRGRVRRSKLYYLRDRVGKAAKVKEVVR
jgi:large subunit ribosomal protein L19